MSTYYYLACKDHKEYCDGASRTLDGVCHLAKSNFYLPKFIFRHQNCDLFVVAEWDDEILDEYTEWEEHNWEELYKKMEKGL